MRLFAFQFFGVVHRVWALVTDILNISKRAAFNIILYTIFGSCYNFFAVLLTRYE
jgi:hypothetical protein